MKIYVACFRKLYNPLSFKPPPKLSKINKPPGGINQRFTVKLRWKQETHKQLKDKMKDRKLPNVGVIV